MIYSIISIYLLILILLIIKVESISIEPSRLLIATVIDPSNDEILRDSLTLLRSIRLFGGKMNEATIIVCIMLDNDENVFIDKTIIDDNGNRIDSLLDTLIHILDVKVVFSKSVEKPNSKTLNKFEVFNYFDPLMHDYFLWLDADVVVFNDPLPMLTVHSYPGQIDCVPEFYDYLRRYPVVNDTDLVWNSMVSSFKHIGDGQFGSHGTCNTGILFFDRLSLSSFLAILPMTINEILSIYDYRNDRFYDSLLFVAAVNMANIPVRTWDKPYSMNYMAFFEVEIQELPVTTTEIYFAQFLSDTTMYCFINEINTLNIDHSYPGECKCFYYNKNIPDKSLLVDKVSTLLPDDICRVMAGQSKPPQFKKKQVNLQEDFYKFKNIVNNEIEKNDIGWTCDLNWIPISESIIRISRSHDSINIPVSICCSYNIGINNNNIINQLIDIEVNIYLNNTSAGDNPSRIDNKNQWVIGKNKSKQVLDSQHILFKSIIHIDLNNSISNEKCFVMNTDFYLHKRNSLDNNMNLIKFHPRNLLDIEINIYNHYKLQKPNKIMTTTSQILLIITSLLPESNYKYSINRLSSSRPISIPTQMLLPSILNERLLFNTGIVLCCDTYKGQEVVKNLISTWEGKALFIVIVSIPDNDNYNQSKLEFFSNELKRLCIKQKDLLEVSCNCVISINSPSNVLAIANSMVDTRISFVYTDIYYNYNQYLNSLFILFDKIHYGGIMMGSRYNIDRTLFWNVINEEDKYCNDININSLSLFNTYLNRNYMKLLTSKKLSVAVETFSERLNHNILVTYNENSIKYNYNNCDNDDKSCHYYIYQNNLPGWFFFKDN
jgi:hypothetical protein